MRKFSPLILLLSIGCGGLRHTEASPLEGVWEPATYHLASGQVLPVSGQIFFHANRWLVLFFVLDPAGQPLRGSAEGGEFSITGNSLSLTHQHILSGGAQAGPLQESPLRMEIREASEECTFEVEGGELTIFFPSGNQMKFRRIT